MEPFRVNAVNLKLTVSGDLEILYDTTACKIYKSAVQILRVGETSIDLFGFLKKLLVGSSGTCRAFYESRRWQCNWRKECGTESIATDSYIKFRRHLKPNQPSASEL